MREPDQGILDHEKKRKVEVKCLELQVELEDQGCVSTHHLQVSRVLTVSIGLRKRRLKLKSQN